MRGKRKSLKLQIETWEKQRGLFEHRAERDGKNLTLLN